MLGSDAVTNVLLAVATDFTDRALNIVAMSGEIDEDARSPLYRAIAEPGDRSTRARRFGDALRSVGADRNLVNECYRVAFYTGKEWTRLLENRLFTYFAANRAGPPLDKWIHYFPIYEQHLGRLRGRKVRVLEIGVYRGGGLALLASYLGPEASIVGIDIDEGARAAVGTRFPVEIGDQADPDFLRDVAERLGPFDVVIDDGGHTMRQQVVSVETLFPLVTAGGVYIVEDCHTSYWREYWDQGPSEPTFIDWVKARIDDLHAYHHSTSEVLEAPWQTLLGAIHAYDSVVVLDRVDSTPPFSEVSGTAEFINYGRPAGVLQLESLATRDAALTHTVIAETRAAQATALADELIAGASVRSETLDNEVRLLRAELFDAQDAMGRLRIELDAVQEMMDRMSDELSTTQSSLLGSWGIIQEMRGSLSWRLTGPLRRLRSLLTRR